MFRYVVQVGFGIVLIGSTLASSPSLAGRKVNQRASDKAMNALRLDFMRDGTKGDESVIVGLYNEACQKGYRPACGWQSWHSEDGADLAKAGEIFAPLCARRDALACVVQGWVHEMNAKGESDTKERDRAYVLAAKHYKLACDTAGLAGISGCYELAEMRAKGTGMSVSTQAAYDLHEWTCNAGYGLSCVGLARLMPQELEFLPPQKEGEDPKLKKGTSGELYKRACDQGIQAGCYQFGILMKAQWPQDEQRSWFHDLCHEGYPASCLSYADTFGANSPEDLKNKADALNKGCELGGGEACYQIGQANEGGTFGVVDLKAAGQAYGKGCDVKFAKACGALGRLVADGQYGADRTMAANYLERGCDGGLVTACVLLGELYLEGDWVEKNAKKALKLLTPGCVDGEIVHPKACKGIAMLYSEGSGVTRNRVEAARYLGVACEMGDLESCFLQGEQFNRYRGDERYDDVALMAFSKACNGGLAKACISSGRILEQGALKLRDNAAASASYQTACDSGLSNGCLSLGSLLERGGGTAPDFEKAREAFKKGMDLGHIEAQRRYARMLWHGLGGKRQRGYSRKLYQDACQKGLSKACAGWRL